MELIKAIILGLVQGLSEFLPISSSGHLVIFAEILNFHEEGIAFEVFVHFGTLLSVLLAFRKEISKMVIAPFAIWFNKSKDPELREFLNWDYYVIIATIPAVIIGFTLKDPIEGLFSNILLVFFTLIATAIMMITAQFLKFRNKDLSYGRSFLIGIAQAIAILPGIIMSLPAVFGATILKLKDMMETPPASS